MEGKRVYNHTQTVIDGQTGEILRRTQSETTVSQGEPGYIKVYLQDVLALHNCSLGGIKVLCYLWECTNYANDRFYPNCCVVSKGVKKYIAETCGFKNCKSVDNIIAGLCKNRIIEKVEKGIYRMNPYLFGRGDWRDIRRIRTTTDYDLEAEKRVTKSEFVYKGQEEEGQGQNV